jgi:cell division protease FtsH
VPDERPDRRPPQRRSDDGDGDGQPPRRSRGLLIWLLIIGGVILFVSLVHGPDSGGAGRKDVFYNEVEQAVAEGKVRRLVVHNQTTLYVTPREGAPSKKGNLPAEEFHITISPEVIQPLREAVQAYNAETPEAERVSLGFKETSSLVQNLIGMLPWLLMLFLLYYLFIRQIRSAGSGVLSFGRSRARPANPEQTKITFEDVAGIDEAKEEVVEIIEFLKSPEKFHRLGGRVPRGILLVGPPGSGKTLLAKAIAGEAGRPFFSISGSDFVEMFVGVGASRVRDLFKNAKEHAPCIVFLDEIDAVGRRRGTGLGGGHDEREQTLNAILVEMDGFETDAGVILIAATNRPDVLDPALLRPGRFDRRIVVDLPDVKGRAAILKVHADKVKLADDVDLKVIARGTPYFSGADLENLLNEAALIAVRRKRDAIAMPDLEEARDKLMFGPEKKSRVIAEEEKRLTAYHETGHAVVSKELPNAEPVHKVAIVARGMALGSTMYLPERDRYTMPRRRILDQITSVLGGRAAEAVFCEDITTGAQNDLERATNLARTMVCRWGMSEKLGLVSYIENEEHIFLGREITRVNNVSEATAVAIDEEVRRITDEAYQRAKEILESRRDTVDHIVKALMKYETIEGPELDILMEGGEIEREENHEAPEEEPPSDQDGPGAAPTPEATEEPPQDAQAASSQSPAEDDESPSKV